MTTESHTSMEYVQHVLVLTFRHESFEIPTKGAEDLSNAETGIVENIDIHPIVDDSSALLDTSMESADSLASPTGSGLLPLTCLMPDLITITKSFGEFTPVRISTPLRHSFTYESGWTTQMSIATPTVQPTPNGNDADDADMDLTECATAQFEYVGPSENSRRVSVAPPKEAPKQQSSVPKRRESVYSRRVSSVDRRVSTASAMDITQTYGDIISVNDLNEQEEEKYMSAQESTPSRSTRSSLRGPPSEVDLEQKKTPQKQTKASAKSAENTPDKDDQPQTILNRKKCLTTPNKGKKKAAVELDIDMDLASPMTRSKRRMMKQLSQTSNSSESTLTSLESDLASSQQVTSSQMSKTHNVDVSASPSASQMSLLNTQMSQNNEEITIGFPAASNLESIREDWIDNVSFREVGGSEVQEETNDTEIISIPVTPVKTNKRAFMNALAEALNDESVPELCFPRFPPSVLEETCKMEMENYEKIINDFTYLFDRDVGIYSALVEDADRLQDVIVTQFENDFDGFLAMLEVAKRDSEVDILSDMTASFSVAFDMYSKMMQEYRNFLNEVVSQKQYPVDTSSILASLEAKVDEEEREYLQVKERANEVNQLSSKEYEDLAVMRDSVAAEIQDLEAQIQSVEEELSGLDKNYIALLSEQKEQQELKDSIRFDFDEIQSRDLPLEEAKGTLVEYLQIIQEHYELLKKISLWSLEAAGEKVVLDYRQGLAKVLVSNDGQVEVTDSKVPISQNKTQTVGEVFA